MLSVLPAANGLTSWDILSLLIMVGAGGTMPPLYYLAYKGLGKKLTKFGRKYAEVTASRSRDQLGNIRAELVQSRLSDLISVSNVSERAEKRHFSRAKINFFVCNLIAMLGSLCFFPGNYAFFYSSYESKTELIIGSVFSASGLFVAVSPMVEQGNSEKLARTLNAPNVHKYSFQSPSYSSSTS